MGMDRTEIVSLAMDWTPWQVLRYVVICLGLSLVVAVAADGWTRDGGLARMRRPLTRAWAWSQRGLTGSERILALILSVINMACGWDILMLHGAMRTMQQEGTAAAIAATERNKLQQDLLALQHLRWSLEADLERAQSHIAELQAQWDAAKALTAPPRRWWRWWK